MLDLEVLIRESISIFANGTQAIPRDYIST